MFNITMLRLISFNMDYYWSCQNETKTDVGAFDSVGRMSSYLFVFLG